MKKLLKILLLGIVLIAVIAAIFAYGLSRELREPALTGTFQRDQLSVGPLQRNFGFYRPQRTAAQPALLFILHGSNGSGDFMRRVSLYRFDALADQQGFIVVYPDGYKNFWNDCRKGADYAANRENIDDPAFFAAMIDHFAKNHGADRRRVYALGASNGGHMVYRLGLELPQQFAALAAVSASFPVDANLDCTQSRQPVSMAILNGTLDPINPFNGGVVNILGNSSRGEVHSTQYTATYWANLAQAPLIEAKELPEADGDADTRIKRDIYKAADGTEVRLYTLHGAGHVLPMYQPFFLRQTMRLLGGAAGDMEAVPELWDFFSAHTSN